MAVDQITPLQHTTMNISSHRNLPQVLAPHPDRLRRQSGPRSHPQRDILDRDGAPLVLAEIVSRFPQLRHVFADGCYAGDKFKDTLCQIGRWTIEIVKRSDTTKVLAIPSGCIVERTLARLKRNRRLDSARRTPHRKAVKSRRLTLNQSLMRVSLPKSNLGLIRMQIIL